MKIKVFPLFIPNIYLCVLIAEYVLVITSKFKYNYYVYKLQQLNSRTISNLTHCTRIKLREDMGPLCPNISRKTLGISKYFLTQKVMKNYEFSNEQKISTPYIFNILRGTVSTLSYNEVPVFS